MAREVKQWIIVNGAHVPIFEGQSKEEAVKQAISRQKKRGPVSSDTRKKAVGDYVDKKRQYRDAYDRAEIEQRHYDRASNKEDRDAAKDRLKVASKDRDSKLQEYAKASDRVANLGKGGQVRRGTEFGKKNPNTKKEEQQKQMGPLEKEARKLANNPSGKLSKAEKFHMQMREAKRRREQGIPTKYGTPDHSKLSQHSEIQKIAEAHNEAVWTREGGVANKELYDAADKFAEKNNLPKDKVRKAAMAAFIEKHSESIKRRDAGQEPIEKKPSPAVNASGTMTPDQLAKAEKKRDALYNKQDHGSLNDSEKKELGQLEKSISGHYQSKKDVGKSSAPEFKNRQEAEEYYKNKFAGVSSTYANKMAKKLGIEGRGKDKREALAKAYADRWETSNNINKDQDLKEKQIVANKKEVDQAGKQLSSFGKETNDKINAYQDKFLKTKTPEQLEHIKNNLEKSGNIVGYTPEDHIALAAVRREQEVRKGKTKVGETSGGTFNAKELNERIARERAEKAAKEKALSDEANRTFKPASDDMKKMAQAETLKSLGIDRNAAINEIRNWTGLSLEDAERRLGSMSADQIKKMLGKQNKTIPKKIPASQVTISDSQYRFSTGKAPKGYGNWAFYLGDDDDKPIFFQGSYADAKKKAVREAANRGVNKIRVGT